jgi:hypothetical protein
MHEVVIVLKKIVSKSSTALKSHGAKKALAVLVLV